MKPYPQRKLQAQVASLVCSIEKEILLSHTFFQKTKGEGKKPPDLFYEACPQYPNTTNAQ